MPVLRGAGTTRMLARVPATEQVRGTYAVRVLGCKVNQYEARQIGRILEGRGLSPAPPDGRPDVVVIHTCAVTKPALRQSHREIRRAREAGAQFVLATGCAGSAMAEDPAPVDALITAGPRWAEDLAAALDRWIPGRDGASDPCGSGDGPPLTSFGGHTRAFLKIQDGCDRFCSYCIVPSLRGPPRDKPLAAIVAEARALAGAGHAEIVVTGVNVGRWDRESGGLAAVLKALAGIDELSRIRLSSLHPEDLSSALLDVMASAPVFMPQIHLPLQSGSDDVLRRMNRGYDRGAFLAAVDRARAALDRPAFTTDVIVGFPGESDREFDDTLDLCRRVGFSRIHVFPFSVRPGTRAADIPGRVPAQVIRRRSETLRKLGRALARKAAAEFNGEIVEVLCETRRRDGAWEGYDRRYFPVRFSGPAMLKGRVARVRLRATDFPVHSGQLQS